LGSKTFKTVDQPNMGLLKQKLFRTEASLEPTCVSPRGADWRPGSVGRLANLGLMEASRGQQVYMPEADNDLVYFFPATRQANLKFSGGRPLFTNKGGDLRKVSAINEKPVNRGLSCTATDIRLASPGQNGGRGGSQENLGERRLFSGRKDPNGDPIRNLRVPRYDELQGVGPEPVLPWMVKKPQEFGRTTPHGHSS
jgi:hypothetical protein